MKAIEKTLDELPQTDADTLYERAHTLRMGDGVRVNFRAAHRLFMLAALKGKRAAFYQLGLMNLRGEGCPINRLHAAMWLKLGVGRDEPRAARNLEMVASALTRAQVKDALALADAFPNTAKAFKQAMSGADADALVTVGEAFAKGHGLDVDPEMASEWYRRALAFHHPRAQMLLGLAYLSGDGVKQHPEEGLRLLNMAAAQGYADAEYELAEVLFPKAATQTQAIALFEAAAHHNHVRAQFRLGQLCKAGEVGRLSTRTTTTHRDTARHLTMAFNWFSKAADQGDVESLFEQGQMHAQGLGTTQDFERAAECYQQAAEKGHAKAAFNLGFLFAHGQGVEQDDVRAYQWYRISELSGYKLAKSSAALCLKRLNAKEKEMAEWRAESFLTQISLG
ncbi:MAG: tetratricopeptide repeat protein [Burkholderiaceae bacterium]